MGMAAVLALWIIWDCCFERHEDDYPHWKVSVLLQPAFPVSRALPLFSCVLCCVCFVGASSSNVLRNPFSTLVGQSRFGDTLLRI